MKNLLLLLLFGVSSCTSVNKLFHKTKDRTDSTSVFHESKDSSAEKSTVILRKDSSKEENEIVIDFGDKKMNIPYNDTSGDQGVYINPTSPNDYFEITRDGAIRTNRVPVSVRIKSSQTAFSSDSLSDHSRIQLSEVKNDSTQVKSVQKDVLKTVHKTKFWWWLLLIVPAYLIYKNWPKIKAFGIHLITGL